MFSSEAQLGAIGQAGDSKGEQLGSSLCPAKSLLLVLLPSLCPPSALPLPLPGAARSHPALGGRDVSLSKVLHLPAACATRKSDRRVLSGLALRCMEAQRSHENEGWEGSREQGAGAGRSVS